jgi:hypothetical protein
MGRGFAGGVLRAGSGWLGARASRPLFRGENSLRTGKSREEQGRAGNFLILEQGIDPPETGNNREFSSL